MSIKNDQDKENIIEEAYEQETSFEDFFVKHWPTFLNVAVGIVILFALYLTFMNYTRKRDIAASSDFTSAKTVQEIQKVLASYPNHPAANFARLRAMKLLTDEKKFEDALKICREIGPSTENPEAFWQAKLDEGYLLELMNKKDEAAEAFSKISSDIKFPSTVRNEASYSAGRLFLASGKKDRALASLKAMDSAAGSEDLWSYQAKALMMGIN